MRRHPDPAASFIGAEERSSNSKQCSPAGWFQGDADTPNRGGEARVTNRKVALGEPCETITRTPGWTIGAGGDIQITGAHARLGRRVAFDDPRINSDPRSS